MFKCSKSKIKNDDIVGHIPDKLAEALYQPLVDGIITVTCCITGQSRPAIEGVWVQGGGIEIPCIYNVQVLKGKKDERKKLKNNLDQLKQDGPCI